MKSINKISVASVAMLIFGFITNIGLQSSTANIKTNNTPAHIFLFPGTPVQQAMMLLRPVKEEGLISMDSSRLPYPLEKIIGEPVSFTMEQLTNYTSEENISLTELGFLNNDTSKHVNADYFVIHDVSTPSYGSHPFPANIDDTTWIWNNLSKWKQDVTHVYINRVGDSKTITDFSDNMQATKFEKKVMDGTAAGSFVHIELIQPRRDVPGSKIKGSEAPEEGFTSAQYKRLALLYITASLRKGYWLIPAFHACIDLGIFNAHDDPQHFELQKWNSAIADLLSNIKLKTPANSALVRG